jgi:hypothetical protein
MISLKNVCFADFRRFRQSLISSLIPDLSMKCRKKHSHLKTQFETIDEYENRSNKRKRNNRDDHRQDKRQTKSQNDRCEKTTSKDTSFLIVDWFNVFVVMIAIISAAAINFSFLWIWNMNTTQHVCHDRFVFIFYELLFKSTSIKNLREHVQVIKIDEVHLRCVERNDVSEILMLHKTTYVLNQEMNLISQRQIHRKSIKLTITNQEIEIDASKILIRLMSNNLYLMNLHQIFSTLFLIIVNENAFKMWHSRLEHLSNVNIKKLINMSTKIDLSKSSIENVCETCVVTQIRFKSHKAIIEFDRYSLDLIHSDVQKSFSEVYENSRYLIIFHDDFIKRFVIYSIKHKSNVFERFRIYKQREEHEEHRIRRFHANDEDEYESITFENYRDEHDIQWESIVSDNSQMNEITERLKQTIMIKTFIKRQKTKINSRYWFELTVIVNLFRNRQFVTDKNIIFYEIHIDRKLELDYLRRVRQTDFVQVKKSVIEWKKFQERSEKCVLIEYEKNHIYRMINSKEEIRRYVIVKWIDQVVSSIFCSTITSETLKRSAFDEIVSSAKRFALDAQQELTVNELINVKKNKLAAFFASILIIVFIVIVFVFVSDFVLTRHSKLRTLSSDCMCFFITIENQKSFESKTYKKVMICSNRNKWIKTMKNEHDSLMINKTWKLVDLSLNRKCLEDKWVFKLKRNFHEEILRYKTRWVIRDFEQREDVNYHETYASMIKSISYKTIFVIVVARDWKLKQMNIKTTFLYEDVNEEIYVKQLIKLNVEDSICRLNKVLYDLKQSSRIWYQILTFFLIKYDFKSLNANLSVFVKENLILVVYVNDLLMFDESMKAIIFEKEALKERFHMIDLRFCSYYLDMFVIRNRRNRILKINLKEYLQRVLQDHMLDSKFVVILMNERLVKISENHRVTNFARHEYQFVVDSLMYAMLETRSNIVFVVFVVNLSEWWF